MFVAGLGAAQFALPAAVDMLRGLRRPDDRPEVVHLTAADPANPYGGLLPWTGPGADHAMSRSAGANVILVNGRLAAFFRRRNPDIQVFLPNDDPERTQFARHLAQKLSEIAARWQSRRGGLLLNASPFLARSSKSPASSPPPPATKCAACPTPPLPRTPMPNPPVRRAPRPAPDPPVRLFEPRSSPRAPIARQLPRSPMPEGDTIYRAARTLNRALSGHLVTRFETQLPQLIASRL